MGAWGTAEGAQWGEGRASGFVVRRWGPGTPRGAGAGRGERGGLAACHHAGGSCTAIRGTRHVSSALSISADQSFLLGQLCDAHPVSQLGNLVILQVYPGARNSEERVVSLC